MVHPVPDGGGGGAVPEQLPEVQISFVVPGSPSSHGVLSAAFVSAEQTPLLQVPATLHGPEAAQTIPTQGSMGGGAGAGGGGGAGRVGSSPQSSIGTTVNVLSPPRPSTRPSGSPPATARDIVNGNSATKFDLAKATMMIGK